MLFLHQSISRFCPSCFDYYYYYYYNYYFVLLFY
jgi:hypothetical protein